LLFDFKFLEKVGLLWAWVVFCRVYFWKTLVGATGFEPVTSSL